MFKKLMLCLAVLLPASAAAQTEIDPSQYVPVPSATHGPAIPDKGYLSRKFAAGSIGSPKGSTRPCSPPPAKA